MRNYSDEYLDQRENAIKTKYSPIKFRTAVRNLSFRSLANKFFNNGCNTYTLEGRIQCEGYRRRSLIDFYRLLMYYRPDISYKDMYRNIKPSQDYLNSTFGYCATVKRTVCYPGRLNTRKIVQDINNE